MIDLDRRLRVVQVLVGGWAALWFAVRLPHNLHLADLPARQWRPVGVLAGFDGPPAAWLAGVVLVATIPLAVLAATGRRPRLWVPPWAGAVLLSATYVSSWGQLFHTENLLVLQALVLAGAVVLRHRPIDAELVLRALAVVTVATYVAAGIAKLRGSGWAWFDGDVLRDKVAFDNVRKATLGGEPSPLGTALVRHAWPWPPLAVMSILVELGAPVALLGRRWAAGWAASAWAFHAGVLALMAIAFPYPLVGIAFAPLLPVERLRAPSVARRWSASSSPSPSPSSP
jgi:hypothetical protein